MAGQGGGRDGPLPGHRPGGLGRVPRRVRQLARRRRTRRRPVGRAGVSRVKPWEIWWLDFDPTEGREQAGQRPALVVSSRFHLDLTAGALVSVLPLTTRERPGWLHRVAIEVPGRRTGWVITEQVRTVSANRLTGHGPVYRLRPEQVAEVRQVLRQMIDV
ncbi:type II toxin-antitoxin system PemK/MazF family toxin [Micromonospora sp. KC721]|nr:type II toxin-antitoxin system PemK/MazF family toxin [Micromonospora sp. KC721]